MLDRRSQSGKPFVFAEAISTCLTWREPCSSVFTSSGFHGILALEIQGCKSLMSCLCFTCSGFATNPHHAARARFGRGWLSFEAASLAAIRSDHVRSNKPDFRSTRNDRTACPEAIRQLMPLRFMRWATSTLFAASTIPDPMPKAVSALRGRIRNTEMTIHAPGLDRRA